MDKRRTAGIQVKTFSCRNFSVGTIEFSPFVVDHDARGISCGFVFFPREDPLSRVAFATDLGCFPDDMVRHFADSRCIVLESNHDTGLLWNNPRRPYTNKQRIASDSGHLSNEQAAQALVKVCAASRTVPRVVVLSHLSNDHNSHRLAVAHVSSALAAKGFAPVVCAAFRDKRMDFIECR
jgi:phosphoribosyl 1,2-cyclic phosphodiesterase